MFLGLKMILSCDIKMLGFWVIKSDGLSGYGLLGFVDNVVSGCELMIVVILVRNVISILWVKCFLIIEFFNNIELRICWVIFINCF